MILSFTLRILFLKKRKKLMQKKAEKNTKEIRGEINEIQIQKDNIKNQLKQKLILYKDQ